MSKVLIITTSLRNNSNSDILASYLKRGAIDARHEVEEVSLKNKTIKFCIGCLTCQKTGKCVLKDDTEEILEKVKNADIIVFATPIYYYELSGQLKTLLDRLNPLYNTSYNFKKVYAIFTAAENENDTFTTAYNGLKGWVDCFPNATLKESINAGGLTGPKEVEQQKDLLNKAYKLGASL